MRVSRESPGPESTACAWPSPEAKNRQRWVLTQFTEIKEAINPAQQVIARNVISEVESVEELILRSRLTHHGVHFRR